MILPIALARREDDGASLLEHGDEVRGNNGLGEEVFAGAE